MKTNRPTPNIYIPGDLAHLFPPIGADLREWRAYLQVVIYDRDGLCWVCSGSTVSYMHEYIRRSHVQGWPPGWRILIHSIYGCIMLCNKHHETALEPAPEEIAAWMCDTYGKEDYCRWARSLPFKSRHPIDGFLRAQGY